MYKIGDFSSITKISKRMLRYYNEKGLLKPQKDELNNYRYYSDANDKVSNGMIQSLLNKISYIFKMPYGSVR